jgi:hypothetical protein
VYLFSVAEHVIEFAPLSGEFEVRHGSWGQACLLKVEFFTAEGQSSIDRLF